MHACFYYGRVTYYLIGTHDPFTTHQAQYSGLWFTRLSPCYHDASCVPWLVPAATGAMLDDQIVPWPIPQQGKTMSTETTTQLYDGICRACEDLAETEEKLRDVNPELADEIKEVRSALSGHALNAYNATEYASRETRKQHKASTSADK